MIFVLFQTFNQIIKPTVKHMITLNIPKLFYKNFYFFSLHRIRMSRKSINFDDTKTKKSEFYKNKKVTKIDKIDVNKILASKEEPYGTNNSFKYFIGYNDNDIIRPSCVKLPQMTGHTKKFEFNSAISFKISEKELLKKYNQICKRIEKLLKIKFDGKAVYGDDKKYIKTKIKTYGASVITNFHNKKNSERKSTVQVFINKNARFCY